MPAPTWNLWWLDLAATWSRPHQIRRVAAVEARPEATQRPRRDLTFRLGLRAVTAVRTEPRMAGLPNLVFVRLVPGLVDQLLPQLPCPMQAALWWLSPGLFLLANLVLKREKCEMEEEFDTKRDLYQRGTLASVQGTHTPTYYGEVRCPETETTGGRALVLSDVGGISFEEAAAGGLKIRRLEAMLLESFGALAAAGKRRRDRGCSCRLARCVVVALHPRSRRA